MKIVYIITRADHYGGAQVHIRDLSKWMREHSREVSVIGGWTGVLSDEIQNNGIRFYQASRLVRSINPIQDVLAFFQLRRILKSLSPNIVSCHSSKAGFLGRLAARSLGIKVVFTAHGWSFTEGVPKPKAFLYRWLEWFGAMVGDHIITVSRYDKLIAMKHKVATRRQMSVVHNGKPFLPKPEKKAHNVVQLCMVARFSSQKDHTTLLNALANLRDKNWHLNLVGDGDNTAYQALATALDIHDKVTFHGQRHDVPAFLETQDIYLLISHWEGFPRSIIEAMRAELPVITTRTAGSPEAVSNYNTGYVVPERNPKALERAINVLISDPERRTAMGQAGRTRYEKRFTFDEMAHRTLNVYETVLGRELTKHAATQDSGLSDHQGMKELSAPRKAS